MSEGTRGLSNDAPVYSPSPLPFDVSWEDAMSARCAEALGETHRLLFEIVRGLPRVGGEPRLLDVGCWDGEVTQRFAGAKRP